MKTTPKLKSTIQNDIGVFMCSVPAILFAILATFLFIKSEILKDQYTNIETIYLSIATFLILSFCLWPFVLWWWSVIYKSFKNGVELTAESNEMNLKIVLGLGIEYTFEYQGKKIKHIASLVSNKKTRALAKEKSLSIIYNPKKDISFVKAAYI